MSEELKPCPCCGSEAELFETAKGFGVECGQYDCNIGTMQTTWTESKALEIWNNRTLTPKQQHADEMYKMLVSLVAHNCLVYGDDYDTVNKLLSKVRGES